MTKVLITGGDGGIAASIIRRLKENGGYEVYAPGRSKLDVTKEADAKAIMEQFRPDILINNAGYLQPAPIAQGDLGVVRRSIEVNLFGVFNCSSAALQANPSVRIIHIASVAASRAHADWSAYCATKAAVVMSAKCWAQEGRDVVCVSPGKTATKMRNGLHQDEDPCTLLQPDDFALVVLKAVQGAYASGSNIEVTRENIENLL